MAHSLKIMRQRNSAEPILPTAEDNVCIVYVTMVKRGRSIFEWGMGSATTMLSHKAGLKDCAEAEHLELFIHEQRVFTHCRLHFSVDSRASPKRYMQPTVGLGGPVLCPYLITEAF